MVRFTSVNATPIRSRGDTILKALTERMEWLKVNIWASRDYAADFVKLCNATETLLIVDDTNERARVLALVSASEIISRYSARMTNDGKPLADEYAAMLDIWIELNAICETLPEITITAAIDPATHVGHFARAADGTMTLDSIHRLDMPEIDIEDIGNQVNELNRTVRHAINSADPRGAEKEAQRIFSEWFEKHGVKVTNKREET